MKPSSDSVLEQIDCESDAAKPTLVNDGLGSTSDSWRIRGILE
jgi:hypothetical protein